MLDVRSDGKYILLHTSAIDNTDLKALLFISTFTSSVVSTY